MMELCDISHDNKYHDMMETCDIEMYVTELHDMMGNVHLPLLMTEIMKFHDFSGVIFKIRPQGSSKHGYFCFSLFMIYTLKGRIYLKNGGHI